MRAKWLTQLISLSWEHIMELEIKVGKEECVCIYIYHELGTDVQRSVLVAGLGKVHWC